MVFPHFYKSIYTYIYIYGGSRFCFSLFSFLCYLVLTFLSYEDNNFISILIMNSRVIFIHGRGHMICQTNQGTEIVIYSQFRKFPLSRLNQPIPKGSSRFHRWNWVGIKISHHRIRKLSNIVRSESLFIKKSLERKQLFSPTNHSIFSNHCLKVPIFIW